jgi:DNA-binding NtrC family response regulator
MTRQDAPGEQALAESVGRGKNESVLVVDDEEVIVNLEARLLENLGYRVTKFTDSEMALAAFRAAPESFDLLVTDMTMPMLTGAELAKEVMRLRPGLPVILCTGFSEAIDQAKAKAMGIVEFLMKPPEKDQLARVVRRALDRG